MSSICFQILIRVRTPARSSSRSRFIKSHSTSSVLVVVAMHGLKGCKRKGGLTTPQLEQNRGAPLPLRMKTSQRTSRPGREQRNSNHSASNVPIFNRERKSDIESKLSIVNIESKTQSKNNRKKNFNRATFNLTISIENLQQLKARSTLSFPRLLRTSALRPSPTPR